MSDLEMNYHTSNGAVALACAQRGVDYMRVWPLPVVQPWQSTPDPVWGWMAERAGHGRERAGAGGGEGEVEEAI